MGKTSAQRALRVFRSLAPPSNENFHNPHLFWIHGSDLGDTQVCLLVSNCPKPYRNLNKRNVGIRSITSGYTCRHSQKGDGIPSTSLTNLFISSLSIIMAFIATYLLECEPNTPIITFSVLHTFIALMMFLRFIWKVYILKQA